MNNPPGPTQGPLVTVIMNCFNGERYLRQAIESVYGQSYSTWEIVFWDNASSDLSAEIAMSFDGRVRYFRGDQTVNLGAARQLALNKARGEWIAFLDCDDIWLPRKLEVQLGAIAQVSDPALCYTGCIEMDGDGRTIRTLLPKFDSGYIFEDLLFQFDINLASAMVRRSDLDKLGLRFDPRIVASEEYWLFMQLALHRPVCVVHQPLVRWRIHGNSLTLRAIERWGSERRLTLDTIRQNNPGIDERFPEAFEEAYARADYYRARYLVSVGDLQAARASMRKIAGLRLRYAFLYLLLYLPRSGWELIHREGIKRRLIRFLGLARYVN